LTYPASSYKYFVEVDGSVEKRSNSFKTIEEFYVSECAKKHDSGHGRIIIGNHHIINGVATSQSDYPTDSNTKDEIKSFYNKRDIQYKSNETKAELLSRIIPMMHKGKEVSKYLKK
jgi:DNA-binding transcriptional regulator GbsR (MarR family)